MALPRLIDRENETALLERQWDAVVDGEPRLVVVLGRRQVGKTFLLRHVIEGIRREGGLALFATGLPSASEGQQLAHVVESLQNGLTDDSLYLPERFDSWNAVLRWAATTARLRPLALVLDEMPWFAESTPTLPGLIQQLWDDFRVDDSDRQPARLFLVLCGSAVASMKAMVDGSGALYGRPAAEVEVLPFDIRAAAQVLPELEPAQLIEAYAACGGYPLHLKAWDPEASTERNIRALAGTPGGLLLRSGERLIVDLPQAGGYRRTLHAVGAGEQRRVDVARSAAQRIEQPLDLLLRSSLVRHTRPLGAPDRFPGRYELDDVYLRFWYEMCWADQGLIEGGAGDSVLARRRGRWQRHLGWVFEELARQHARHLQAAGILPEGHYGEWWRDRGGQVQIDVLGLEGKRTIAAGEARWDARPLGPRDVADLRNRVAAAPDPVDNPVLALWSRGGARPSIVEEGTRVFTPDDLLGLP